MKDTLQTIGKIVIPALLSLLGLYLIFQAVAGGQNTYFLIASIATTLVGIVVLLMVLDKLPSGIQKISVFVFLGFAAVISFFTYKSIQDPIDFQKAKAVRYADVIERLKEIRLAELSYKSVNGKYTANFDSLVSFIRNDKFLVIKASGNVPDGFTEKEAIEKGYAKRDTFYVSVKDSIFSQNPKRIDSLAFIPHSGGDKFKVEAGSVIKGSVTVQVIEVLAPNTSIFKGLTDEFYDKEGGLKFGSMSEPSTNGNWE
jgi:hypothetical protein